MIFHFSRRAFSSAESFACSGRLRFLASCTVRTMRETAEGPTPPKYAPICCPDASLSFRLRYTAAERAWFARGASSCCAEGGPGQLTGPRKMKNQDLTPSTQLERLTHRVHVVEANGGGRAGEGQRRRVGD